MSSNNQNYKFRGFQLDVAERLLLRDGESVSLSPKMFEVLAVLVERGGHLVEKDELLRIVWEDTFVEESNVARIVHSLRKILGEDNSNKFIETVSKKGYRFVAEIEKNDGSMPSRNGFSVETEIALPKSNGKHFWQNADNPIKPVTRRDASKFETIGEFFPEKDLHNEIPVELSSKQNYTYLFFGAITVFAIAVFGIWFYKNAPTANGDNFRHKSIAVLPLKPINNEVSEPIYELGIAESFIFKLNSAKNLTVRPLSATRKYLAFNQNPSDAGKEQQVDYVLASNYQIFDGKIRVTSQLLNVQNGNVEEVFKCETDSANKFSMQDGIANDIGNKLLAQFGNRENNLTAKSDTSNEEAYRLYLRAEVIFEEFDELKIGKAIEYLEQAVKLDPNFAPAQVRLAYAYQMLPTANSAAESNEHYIKSKEAIKKALALDENLAEAYAVLGLIKSNNEGDFAGAEKEYKRAIELNPDSPMAHGLYATYLIIPGRFDEALIEQKKELEIDPASVVDQVFYGMILYNARRYDEAKIYFKKMLEKDKNLYFPYQWLWIISDLQGNESEAYEWFIKYQTQIKTDPVTIKLYQTAYQKSGTKGIKREVIRQDEKQIADNKPDLLYKNYSFYEIACFSALLGNREKAFEYLDKAYEIRKSTLNAIKIDPALDSLHGDPRFDNLVRRIGLPQ